MNIQQQATKLLAQTQVDDLDICLTPDNRFNSSQGVISDPELVNKTDADTQEQLKEHGASAVRRMTMPRVIGEIPSKHNILKFSCYRHSKHIKGGFIRRPVRLYLQPVQLLSVPAVGARHHLRP